MSKNKKMSYACLAGYTTGSGSQDAKITCTAEGWSPAPKCYSKLTLLALLLLRVISVDVPEKSSNGGVEKS